MVPKLAQSYHVLLAPCHDATSIFKTEDTHLFPKMAIVYDEEVVTENASSTRSYVFNSGEIEV